MAASKADQVQKIKRIEQCVKSLLDGHTVQEVVAGLMEQYDLAESTAYEYTKEATARIHQKMDIKIDHHINSHYLRLERLYTKSINAGDVRGARMVLKDIADLLGLDAPKQSNVKMGLDIVDHTKHLSDEEIDERIADYIANHTDK